MPRLTLALTITVLALSALAAQAAAVAGPSPGVLEPGAGIADRSSGVRYVTRAARHGTLVEAVRSRDGRVLSRLSLAPGFGIPLVTYNGAAGGLSRDGRLLVLATIAGAGKSTRFAVLGTKPLRLHKIVTLSGTWSYDALSPDAGTLYVIQYLVIEDVVHYLVRAYSLDTNRLVRGAIVDKSDPGPMSGVPLSRVTSSDGTWVYTLYQREKEEPFVHALNAVGRYAVCLDFKWHGTAKELGAARLTLSRDQSKLVLRHTDGRALMTLKAPR